MMDVSIVVATYNGEKYIKKQLDSVLAQMKANDEMIITDDGSTDKTLDIINAYKDDRINIIYGPKKGFVSNFENGIRSASKELIFTCDQDDIWHQDKLELVSAVFENSNIELVMHAFSCIDANGNPTDIKLARKFSHGILKNLLMSSYWGCCMAFRRELVQYILPFPKTVPTHDQWIGLVSEHRKTSFYINEILVNHRIHSCNVSTKLKIMDKITFRAKMINAYFTIINKYIT